ncbi:hypothetical protein QAD02_010953 [Eretmocerus hayati]|uniref:Uncharacterized protein n=1 Tax=Eretmocerus hayati TaxID=131215 RepID=A0ACC2NVP7_9HYME|nr:hypothetical protein QAD02_010953 [Eretmocerus hayati]
MKVEEIKSDDRFSAFLIRLLSLLLCSSASWSLPQHRSSTSSLSSKWKPCIEVKRDLGIPCRCALTISGQNGTTLALEVDCERTVLSEEALSNLAEHPIVSFSQKSCGYLNLPAQLVSQLPDTIEKLDLSDNSIHNLMDRHLRQMINLRDLRLNGNALGDNLNPIFSSNEFHQLGQLRSLDLSSNGLRGIEEGIFKENTMLEELYLDNNDFIKVPVGSLKGPKSLRVLSLAGNDIGSIQQGAFLLLGKSLVHLDLSDNGLSHLDDGALIGMSSLLVLNISFNDIHRLNSDVLKGAFNLQQLDISSNFLTEFPTDALRHQNELKFLNLSNNLISDLERAHMSNLNDLKILDLSRNNIGRLGINTFSSLTSIERLDLSLNSLRTIEESSFDGLQNLKWLSLQDNNILTVPSTALARLPSLVHLHLESNRISAFSSENLKASAPHLSTFSLTRNLVHELPPRVFSHFDRLVRIELSGNMISGVNQQSFIGVEDTLIDLDLSSNRLSEIDDLSLPHLRTLNLASNLLKRLTPETFRHLGHLQNLNISDNPLHSGFPPLFPRTLVTLDVARTGLQVLPSILMLNLDSLSSVSFSGNRLVKLNSGTFKRQRNLTSVDFSYNEIADIDDETFTGLQSLYYLNLRGNYLRTFKGEYFNTGTGLEILDLSDNVIEHISSTAFLIHPRLREIDLSFNKLSVFPSESIRTLQFLERLDLSNNRLTVIGEFAFSRLARLRVLDLSNNLIESVEELAFHNSSQLQQLNLSKNRLEFLSERMMEGVLWMEKLDLTENQLTSLPDSIFDMSRVGSLHKIDLSGNRFAEIPVQSLKRQTFNLLDLRIARNRLTEIFSQDVINKVKHLDLSENPLTDSAVSGIFGEVKVLRSLNVASCGIQKLAKLEAPFLRRLNLSSNNLEHIELHALERSTMLEELDVSGNQLKTADNVRDALSSPTILHSLDISNNNIKSINESSFVGLDSLKTLRMFGLENCTRIEKNAFKSLVKLRNLQAYNYPRLGYFDVQGIVKPMNNLEILDVEVKDINIGSEQLPVKNHPHLRSLSLRGDRLKNVMSSLLAGVRSSQLEVGFKNTSISAIPATLLLPLPRSTRIEIDVSGSKFESVSPQLISAFDERNGAVTIKGLDFQVKCNCEAKQLWRWYIPLALRQENSIRCNAPEYLVGKVLDQLEEDELSCEVRTTKSTTALRTTVTEPSTSSRRTTTSEPMVIWTASTTTNQDRRNMIKNSNNIDPSIAMAPGTSGVGQAMFADDTLVIGIVCGVIAFLAILIICVCICRLRWSDDAAMAAAYDASMLRPGSAHSGKLAGHEIYVNPYAGSSLAGGAGQHSNGGTLMSGAHMLPLVQPLPLAVPPPSMYGYYDGSPQSIYMTNTNDSKAER